MVTGAGDAICAFKMPVIHSRQVIRSAFFSTEKRIRMRHSNFFFFTSFVRPGYVTKLERNLKLKLLCPPRPPWGFDTLDGTWRHSHWLTDVQLERSEAPTGLRSPPAPQGVLCLTRPSSTRCTCVLRDIRSAVVGSGS